MLDAKGLEAAARKLRNAEKEKFGSWPDADDSKSIAAAAITAYLQTVGPEPAVAVKPLEWVRRPHQSLSRAETDLGVYRAWTHFEAGGRWFWSLDGYQKVSGEVSDEDEAKAAAQADHDKRISSRIRSAVHFVRNNAMNMERDYPEICHAEEVFSRARAALSGSNPVWREPEPIKEVKALRQALLECRERAETGGRRIETAMDACEDISEIATCALPPEGWQGPAAPQQGGE